jgi:hypothetical protein
MSAPAPEFRSVCQLTGEKQSPSKFFEAMGEADARVDEVEQLRAAVAMWSTAYITGLAKRATLLRENAELKHALALIIGKLDAALGERDTARATGGVA